MGADGYADIRVEFEQRGPREYAVMAATDDGFTAHSTFVIPMSADEMQAAVVALGRTRSATRAVTAVEPNPVSAEHFGATLAEAFLTGEVAALYDRVRSGSKVRLTLLLGEEPELLSIPWEFLYRQSMFLAAQRSSPIVRELETTAPGHRRTVAGPLKMLGVVASPTGLPELDVTGEVARVEATIAAFGDRISVEWLGVERQPDGTLRRAPCTFTALREQLSDNSFHILHFVGHGAFADGQSSLFLTTPDGAPDQVSATKLANQLGDQDALQLVVLNSCEGARTTVDDPFAGVATKLVQQGCGAVVAMQFEITDLAAKQFAGSFYSSLIDKRLPVDQAMSEARKAIWDVDDVEFATPVLFLRRGAADLFEFSAAEPHSSPAAPPSPEPLVAPSSPPTRGRPNRRLLVGAGVGALVLVGGVTAVIVNRGGDLVGSAAVTTPVAATASPFVGPLMMPGSARQAENCLQGPLFVFGTAGDALTVPAALDALKRAADQCAATVGSMEADGFTREAGSLYLLFTDRIDAVDAFVAAVEKKTATEADAAALDLQAEGLRTSGLSLLDALTNL